MTEFNGRWAVRLPRRWGGYFRNDADHRDFASIGTAAGVLSVAQDLTSVPASAAGMTQALVSLENILVQLPRH